MIAMVTSTRSTLSIKASRLTIQDYLWSDETRLPETYSEDEVQDKTEAVFVHVFRAYPMVPSRLAPLQTNGALHYRHWL